MKVADILRVKGGPALLTTAPDTPLTAALQTMADEDIGSLLVVENGQFLGLVTFREVIAAVVDNGGSAHKISVRSSMQLHPPVCSPQTELGDVRRLMLDHHARYLPVMDKQTLLGVISFYDVAKAVVDSQGFENRMLKAYIRDCPFEETETG
jgi:CBS domain-containing protein